MQLPGPCLDMPAAYAISNIVVAPSTKPESFGRIPIESQVMGKPIICSGHGGFCETVINGKTGFLFIPNNATDFANVIDTVLSMTEKERNSSASLARKTVTELYSVDRMCALTIQLYESLCNSDIQSENTIHSEYTDALKKKSPLAVY
jgi:glycosyltransferase involved in cell wall biosynthesis